ncbi:MAG: acyl carrier protein [bacterium]
METTEIIEKKAKDIVVDKLSVDEDQVTHEANFLHDLGADSLDTVELGMDFEQEFDITINDDEWEKIETFGDAVALIKEKIKNK